MRLVTCLLLAVLFISCDDTPDIDQTWQLVCDENLDTCPGGHALTPKAFTINDLKNWGRYDGFYVPTSPNAACNALSCWASVSTASQQFRADCFDFVAVAWCSHTQCNVVDYDDDSTGWECHDVPPLEFAGEG